MMGALLTFPERDKGRKRRRNSTGAMGDCSLMVNREQPIPGNVARLARHTPGRTCALVSSDDPVLLLATAIYAVLPAECKADLLDQLRCLSLGMRDRRADAVLDIIDKARW